MRGRGGDDYNDSEAFNFRKIPFEKYFVGNQLKEVLIDFEEYMSCVRLGGTNSKARNKED